MEPEEHSAASGDAASPAGGRRLRRALARRFPRTRRGYNWVRIQGRHYLGRALAMLYCWLVFLAALGLFASSFLSFPVACMLCILIYTVGMGAGFFTEAVDNSDTLDPARDPFGMAGPVFRLVGFAFLWVVPDFAFYDPAPRLVDGRLVSLVWLLRAVGLVAIARTVVIGALACVLFHRRELAEVVV